MSAAVKVQHEGVEAEPSKASQIFVFICLFFYDEQRLYTLFDPREIKSLRCMKDEVAVSVMNAGLTACNTTPWDEITW